MNQMQIPMTDKQALINLAISVVEKLRNIGKSENEIADILKDYNFSELMLEQIM